MKFAQPFEDYEILSRVGAGAMGTVFRARQKKMNRIVALKVLRPSLARNRKYVERLRREARIVGALNHPNIVTGYDLGEEGGYHYFVMEFVEGKSLQSLLQEWGLFPEERVLEVGIQVAEALEHAFARDVIHRDIKPGNILIDDAGHVKLTDMGLAKGPTDLTLTRDGATVGTPHFISPEQAVDPQSADARSDLYSLGATLFQMATGAAPFSGDSIGRLIDQVLNEPAPLVSDVNPDVSQGLSLVIKKLLAKDPALRYQTPSELLVDLRRVANHEAPGVDLKRLEKADRAYGRPRPDRRPRRTLVAVAAVGVLLGLLGWWAVQALSDHGDSGETSTDRVVRELRGALENATSLRERIAICDRFARSSDTEREREAVRAVAAEPRDELRGALIAYGDEAVAPGAVDAWINDPAHWQDPHGYVARVEHGMAAAVGFRRDELPADAAAVWSDTARSIEAELRRRMTQRDQEYLAAFERHLEQDVGRRLGARLAAGEFEPAREALRDGVAEFHGDEGRPQLAQLAGELRRSIDDRSLEFEQRWSRAIRDEERDVAESLREDVRREVASIREALVGGGVASVLRARLEEFHARHLPGHYPTTDCFSRSANPWPDVQREVTALSRDLWSEEQAHARRELSDYLQFGYRVLVSGSVEQAIGVVGRKSDTDVDRARVERHLALLRAAAKVRDLVLERLIASAPRRSVPVRGGKVLVVRASDGRVGLFDARGERPLAFAIVAASLLDSVRGGIVRDIGEDGDLAAGLALWFVVAADTGSGNSIVASDPVWQDFFATDVVRLVADSAVPTIQDAAPATTGVLAELVRAREAGDLRKAEYWLGVVDAQHVLDDTDRGVRDDVAHWIERESARVARLDVLRRRAPEAALLELGEDGGEHAAYPLPALAALDAHAAWEVRGDSLALIAAEDPTLGQAWEQRLEIDSVVDTARGVRAEIELSFPDRGALPRVLLASLTGAACAIVVLPNGLVAASVVDPAALRNPVDLRRALTPLLSNATSSEAWALSGAHHSLSLTLAGAGRTRFTVGFDGVPICDEKVGVGANHPESLVLVPLQSIAIHSIAIASPGR